MKKKNHVIIAPSLWDNDPLKYRRHRLAVFLQGQQETEKVIWIAPEITGNPKSAVQSPSIETLGNGIEQIRVADFKSLIKLLPVLQKKLVKQVKGIAEEQACYLWYTYPAFASLANLPVWESVIYDCSDNWQEAERPTDNWFYRLKSRLIVRAEHQVVRSADICFSSSAELESYLKKFTKQGIHLVENGVDFSIFQQQNNADTNKEAPPTLGFVGGLKPWKLDFPLLLQLAKARPDWRIVLVGADYGDKTAAYLELLAQPNVKKYVAVPFEEIPGMISQFDVGLLPYLENEYNKGVFPLKYYEYLAAGIPVVGCGLPSTKKYQEEAVYYYRSNDPEAFLLACEKALNARHQNPEKRQALAKRADWQEKLAFIWEKARID